MDIHTESDEVKQLREELDYLRKSFLRSQRNTRHSIDLLEVTHSDQLKSKERTINALKSRVEKLHSEREEMLAMMKRLLCSYEGDYQFSCNVADFLRSRTDYRGTMNPSTKLTLSELTELRGGM